MKALTASFLLPIASPSIPDGALVIADEEDGSHDGRMLAIGPRVKVLGEFPQAKIEEFPQSVLMPGLVNAHTCLDLLFFEGPQQTGSFFDRLLASWNYRRCQTPADRRQCLEEGIRQLLQSGTTTVGDSGNYVGVIPQAANSPMRMVLFPKLLSGGDQDIRESYEGLLAQIEEILSSHSSRLGAGIAPYAAYTLSRHLLKIIAEQAREKRIPLKIHVAETFQEMQFFFESKGEIAEKLFPQIGWGGELPPEHRKTPIQYLDSIGFLENGPILIGCNQLADADLQTIAKTGSKVVHSPRSNTALKLGIPPIRKILASGIPLALGTDGGSLSLWDEMRTIQDHYPEGDRPTAFQLLTMATLNGAKALGLGEKIGSLEPGKEADLVAIRIPKEVAANDLPSWLVSHVTPREISAVFVQGKRIKM